MSKTGDPWSSHFGGILRSPGGSLYVLICDTCGRRIGFFASSIKVALQIWGRHLRRFGGALHGIPPGP